MATSLSNDEVPVAIRWQCVAQKRESEPTEKAAPGPHGYMRYHRVRIQLALSFLGFGSKLQWRRGAEDEPIHGLRIERPQLHDEIPRHQHGAHREQNIARQAHPLPEQHRAV